jgi:hypothetical protein
MQITIDKDVPAPGSRRTNPVMRAASSMDVGDSFVAPQGMERSHLSALLSQLAKGTGRKFTTRQIDGGLVRVWRIS